MNVSEALKGAGYEPEKSTVGDKTLLDGVYKCSFFKAELMEDKGYGESVYAQFKVLETMAGVEPFANSQYPELRAYYSLAPDKIASKRNGLAKLLNGLFSIGVEIDTSNVIESLAGNAGAEVYIKAYKEQPKKKEGDEWVDDLDKDLRQGFTFLTEKNAKKLAEKASAKKPF